MKNFLICIAIVFIVIGCNKKQVNGIEIGYNLYSNQTYAENKNLVDLIVQTLNKDKESFSDLINYWCGGGSGCYDLGFVFTQLVYDLGEVNFTKMVINLNQKERFQLKGHLEVGFEYGNYSGKKLEVEFPILAEILTNKNYMLIYLTEGYGVGEFKTDNYTFCSFMPKEIEYEYKIGDWKFWNREKELIAEGIFEIIIDTIYAGGCDANIKKGKINIPNWKFYDSDGNEVKAKKNTISILEKSKKQLLLFPD